MTGPRHPVHGPARRIQVRRSIAVLLTGVLVALVGTLVGASANASSTPAQQLLAAALAARDTRPVVMVGAGSSTTAGSYATAVENRWLNVAARGLQSRYPLATGAAQPGTRSLAAALQQRPSAPGIQLVNAGVGGTTAANYLTSTTGAQVASLRPDVVFHMVGSNDFARDVGISTYRDNLTARIDQIDADSPATVLHVLVHPYERSDANVTDGTRHRWAEYGAVLTGLAAARPGNVMALDVSPDFYAAGVPGADPGRLMDADRIHLVDAGHAFLADLVLRDLTATVPTPSPTTTAPAPSPTTATTTPTTPAPTTTAPGTVVRELFVSTRPDRTDSVRLDGATLTAATPVYVHAAVSDGWRSVKFYVDDPGMTRTPVRTDSAAPFDLLGSTTTGDAVALVPATLGAGTHTVTASIKLASGVNTTKTATFTVSDAPTPTSTAPTPTTTAPTPSPTTPTSTPTSTAPTTTAPTSTAPGTVVRELFVSTRPDRTDSVRLDGATLTATTPVYVHAAVSDGWRSVKFYVDDPGMTRTPVRTDSAAPFDLLGSTTTGDAVALVPATLGAGTHTVTASIKLASGVNTTKTATFTVR